MGKRKEVIDSQAKEIKDTVRETSALANDIANKWQLDNLCFNNVKKLMNKG